MIDITAGAELCATHANRNPNSSDCIRSTDHTYLGKVDLSSKVSVGTPVQTSELRWKVPYNVKDEAGNAAKTVWREIVVEEVDINELERKLRSDILADKEIAIKTAVEEALEKERKLLSSTATKEKKTPTCPSCPSCEVGSGISVEECTMICDERIKTMGSTCSVPQSELYTYNYFAKFPDGFPIMNWMYAVCGVIIIFLLLGPIQNVLVGRGQMYYHSPEDEQREREMLNSVTYFRSPENIRSTGQTMNGSNQYPRTTSVPGQGRSGRSPPRVSLSVGTVNGFDGSNNGRFFSPSQQEGNEGRGNPEVSGEDSIYQHMSPIPARSGRYNENPTPYNLSRRY